MSRILEIPAEIKFVMYQIKSVMKVTITIKRRSALQIEIEKEICDVSGTSHQNEI